MKSDVLNKWLTLGANIGVLIGLVFVAYEIRRTQKQLEITALADISDNFTQAMEMLAQDEELAELLFRAESEFNELDPFEQWRVYKYLDGYISMAEQDFILVEKLEIDINFSGFYYDWNRNVQKSHFRAYWSENEMRYDGSPFRAFINDLMAEN